MLNKFKITEFILNYFIKLSFEKFWQINIIILINYQQIWVY